MSLFTSDRERRFWLWTLAVVVAIYSSLGLARTLSDELRNRELFGVFFLLGLLLMGATIVTLSVKTPPGVAEIGVALGVGGAYLLVLPRIALEAERTHLFEYGLVAVLMYEALKERAAHGGRPRRPALIAIVATSLVGLLDELIQALIPSRVFDPVDIQANVLAAVMAITASLALARAGRRKLGASG